MMGSIKTIFAAAVLVLSMMDLCKAETLQVSAYGIPEVTSAALEDGRLYQIEVSGTVVFDNANGRQADAEWLQYTPHSQVWTEAPDTPGLGSVDLLINGIEVDWRGTTNGINFAPHVFSPDHRYRYEVVGTGQPLVFQFDDPGPSQPYDNSGAFEVAITPIRQFYAILAGGAGSSGRRGDLDAEAIRSALLEFPGVRADNLTVTRTAGETRTAIDSVIHQIQPGDSLLFFYSGHGSYSNNGTEPQIENQPNTWEKTGDQFNTGDEIINFGRGLGYITDDELTHLLSSEAKMEDVHKLAIFDNCFSGGFWGQPGNESDMGDLEKVPNTAILASVTEDALSPFFNSSSLVWTGRGFFSIALENVLENLADFDPLGLSFSSLALGLFAEYTNDNFPEEGGISDFPWIDSEVTIPVEGDLTVVSLATPDFDQDMPLVVPECSTIIQLALVLPFLLSSRRNRYS